MNSRRKFEKIRRVSGVSSSPRQVQVFVGILTVNDRCALGEKIDSSGPNLQKIIQEYDGLRAIVKVYKIVPDDEDQIAATLKHWCDDLQLQLIITTGGTGIGPRDVTPEATASVIDKETPGFTIAIITASLKVTPDAMVTRLKSGIRGSTIIINVPGSTKASAECLQVVLPAIPHGIECLQYKADRGCSCAVTEDFSETPAVKRKLVTRERNMRSTEADRQVSSNFPTCQNGDHSLTYKPTAVLSITEDERTLADADIESILSADETMLTFSSPASENQDETLNIVTNRNVPTSESRTVTEEEALTIIRETVRNNESEEVPIIDAFGRILSEDIRVTRNVPTGQNPIDNSGTRTTTAGNINLNNMRNDQSPQTTLRNSMKGNSTDNVVVKHGTLLTAYHIGLLAAQGLTMCRTFKTPDVGVLSIGEKDKIISDHVTSQIFLQQNSIKTIDLGIIGHNMGLLPEMFRSSMSKVDIVVVISNLEACREMAASLITKIFGGTVQFDTMSMRPRAKCIFVTTYRNGKQNLFFIVPENPVGSTICSLALIPAYRMMAGYEEISHKRITAKFPMDKDLRPEPEYLQCKVADQRDGIATIEKIIGSEKESGRQFQYGINALAVIPGSNDPRSSIRKGDNIDVLLIDVNNCN